MPLKLKASIGRKRIPKNLDPAEAGYQRQINRQMKEIIDNYKEVITAVRDQTGKAMLKALGPIFQESQVLVPVDKGPLKASGYLELRELSSGPVVEIGYAKAGKPEYAVFVHEMVQLNHESPTQAKFLQVPIERHLDKILDDISGELKYVG